MNKINLIAGLVVTVLIALVLIAVYLKNPNSTHQLSVGTAGPDVILDFSQGLSQAENDRFLAVLTSPDPTERIELLREIKKDWHPAYIPITLEIFHFVDPIVSTELLVLLEKHTKQNFGRDTNAWFQWLWNHPDYGTIENYDNFKADFYKQIDPRFETYFRDRNDSARVRLDEIRWGGVVQDGIPPLRNPEMITAAEADYLNDDDIVFGIEVNGDVRAYPKRILAWHELFTDTVGGTDVAGVYCTLCGTVILYESEFEGVKHDIGTSGFLYRSNKLMYDAATQSLWNTIRGEPVLGPLVDQGIALKHQSVVTTTWSEWKKRNPTTLVLSLDTGHRRDYGEGVAYNEYFATDRLMFNTPFNNTELNNKDEVLALRFAAHPKEQLAISTDFLVENRIYVDSIGEQSFVVITDDTGANRVYDPENVVFTETTNETVTDTEGVVWQINESNLVSSNGRTLERLPYHRAFWFGWHATYPESRLIK